MPHVELSLSGLSVDRERQQPGGGSLDPSVRRWAEAVATAVEPSLVIDSRALVVAMSPSCVRLLGFKKAPLGKKATGGALRLIDFSTAAAPLTDTEVAKVPPLLSLSSGRLARGLIRVECPDGACTLDAVATPIGEQSDVVGSLTFFSPV
ncbi:hypothetical protein Val02_83550 [Virgisporangium aliadipatigenens]|uniref:PAS domain-containing protein n=1 Tax=Virgisporangium aliadipatigenens TaxID=741659 RepID=A0A8J3YT99_9ACTN|nr:hypothetical protein [Virgisporangium aliadipatigenens]GIJ51469.1 hypothetical protein Val02_83550 [Virgisporangium aliadipatigenens]